MVKNAARIMQNSADRSAEKRNVFNTLLFFSLRGNEEIRNGKINSGSFKNKSSVILLLFEE